MFQYFCEMDDYLSGKEIFPAFYYVITLNTPYCVFNILDHNEIYNFGKADGYLNSHVEALCQPQIASFDLQLFCYISGLIFCINALCIQVKKFPAFIHNHN